MPKKTYSRKKSLPNTLLSVDAMPQIPVSVDQLFPAHCFEQTYGCNKFTAVATIVFEPVRQAVVWLSDLRDFISLSFTHHKEYPVD